MRDPHIWSIGRHFMLRVGGLPVEAVQGLRCPRSSSWAKDVLGEEARLAALGSALGDILHGHIGNSDDEAWRRELLAIRRQLFNNRAPRNPQEWAPVASRLGQPLGADVSAWLRDRLVLEDLRKAGGAIVATELDATRSELRRQLEQDRLRSGLLLASPTLDAQLASFIARSARPDKRTRKTERSVLAYLYRTACKTSPFSTFTGVALGHFEDGTCAPGFDMFVPPHWSSHPRLSVIVLQRVAELILTDPVRRADLPISLASGWAREEDRVRYVRRSLTAGDNDASVTFDSVSDELFFLRSSGILERMLETVQRRPDVRWADLLAWLQDTEDAPAQDCERYLETLLALGMVQVPWLRTDVHSIDPLRAFQAALREIARPWADRMAVALDPCIGLIGDYATAAPTARRRLLPQLRRGLQNAVQELGHGDAALPQTLLYEDVRAGAARVTCDLTEWTELAAAPLESLGRILPAFDAAIPPKLTLQAFFVARYGRGGRCEDLLKLVHEFHEDFFEEYRNATARRVFFDADDNYVPEPNWLASPGIAALDMARALFHRRMTQLWGAEADAEELHLPERLVLDVAAELRPLATQFSAQSHFLQLARRSGEPLIVLGKTYGDLAFPFSRFTHCFDTDDAAGGDGGGLSELLRRTARELQPRGAVFAEVTGGAATTNLNLHGRLTDYEVVLPGEVSSVPEQDRIALDDLILEHAVDADRLVLRSKRLDCEVVPVYLGYLLPQMLPAVSRTLLLLSPTSMVSFDVWAGVPEGPAEQGVTRRPRVCYGPVVLGRSTWSVNSEDLPIGPAEASDAQRFLDWRRWRLTHRLPERVFATLSRADAERLPGRARPGQSKPQYVDFESLLSLLALEAAARGSGARVVMTEMLPGEDELHVRSEAGRHVAELVVETFRVPVAPAEGLK